MYSQSHILCTANEVSSPKPCWLITNSLGDRNVQTACPPGQFSALIRNIAAHHMEMGNLLSVYPKVHYLAAHAKNHGGAAIAQREFFARVNFCSASVRGVHSGRGVL